MEWLADLIELYRSGLPIVFSGRAILLIFLGTFIGITFGCLPGMTSTMTLAIFMPLTFGLSAGHAIVFLVAMYMAAAYGGAISAILANIPGTPSAVATCFDGYPMAQRGEAKRAMGLAAVSSFAGGIIGVSILMLFAPSIARFAREFGSWEFALLGVLGLTLIAYVAGGALYKGLAGGAIGLLIATVGQDVITAYPRFVGTTTELLGGFDLVVLLIGFFGVAEVFSQIEAGLKLTVLQNIKGSFGPVLRDVARHWKTVIRSAVLGTIIGAIPGPGGGVANITSYAITKRLSRERHLLGTGTPEGVVAAETADNASVGGALIPTLTFGIPGDSMTAVLLGAVMVHGLLPGPRLFLENPDFVSAIFLGLLVALVFMVLQALLLAPVFARLLSFPQPIVMPVILCLCFTGAYLSQNSFFDIGVALATGVLGYLLRKVDIHPAPIVLGIILGHIIEDNFRRALLLSDGSLLPFFTRPISLALTLTIFLVIFGPLVGMVVRGMRKRKAES